MVSERQHSCEGSLKPPFPRQTASRLFVRPLFSFWKIWNIPGISCFSAILCRRFVRVSVSRKKEKAFCLFAFKSLRPLFLRPDIIVTQAPQGWSIPFFCLFLFFSEPRRHVRPSLTAIFSASILSVISLTSLPTFSGTCASDAVKTETLFFSMAVSIRGFIPIRGSP